MVLSHSVPDYNYLYVIEIPGSIILLNNSKEDDYFNLVRNYIEEIIKEYFINIIKNVNYICVFQNYTTLKNKFPNIRISEEQFMGTGDIFTRGIFDNKSMLLLFKSGLFISDIENIIGQSCKRDEFYDMLISSKRETIIHELCHLKTFVEQKDVFKLILNDTRSQILKDICYNFFNEYISEYNTMLYLNSNNLIEYLYIEVIEQTTFTHEQAITYINRALYWLSRYCASSRINKKNVLKFKNKNNDLCALNSVVTKHLSLIYNMIIDSKNILDKNLINSFFNVLDLCIQELSI